ncbi:DUF4132 domain-containing protein [Spirillospora sp. NPDC052242]
MDRVPDVLVRPPWLTGWREPERTVVKGLAAPPARAEWAPGERDGWTSRAGGPAGAGPAGEDWEEDARGFAVGYLWPAHAQFTLLGHGPDELVRPLLARWKPTALDHGDAAERLGGVAARFGADAVKPVVAAARSSAALFGYAIGPFLDGAVATLVANWLTAANRDARDTARAWLDRHGVDAVPYLLPAALGARATARATARANAWLALRALAARHSADAVIRAAGEHGVAVAPIVADLPPTEPGDRWLFAHLAPPRPGEWATAGLEVPLRDGSALPPAAVEAFVTLLALSAEAGEPHPGLAGVRAACAPGALADVAWRLFERWEAAGAPGADAWTIDALGLLGDDSTAARLAPIVRDWPGRNLHHRAVQALDVFAAIGTEAALRALDGIARGTKFGGLRGEAEGKLAEVAEGLGLTGDQLADRLVPRFGLDGDGVLVLDYGPRRFTVGFDEQLKPFVVDESGKLRKTLPKPGVKDDPESAPAAHQAFAALKKDVRATAAAQLGRLERAMLDGRVWRAAEFREHLAGHPLMRHVVRRLVWTSGGAGFRLAEDGTFADVRDDAFVPPEEAEVRLPHPLHLGDGLAAWSEVFADYEILQPFAQLARPVHAFTEDERAAWCLARFEKLEVPSGRLLGLEKRRWRRGAPQDNGAQRWLEYRAASYCVVISLRSGFNVNRPIIEETDVIERVWIGDRPDWWPPREDTGRAFAELDPVTASEILTDLTALADAAV